MFIFVPYPVPSQELVNFASATSRLFFPSNILILDGFSGPVAILDKLLSSMDPMTRQPSCCLQIPASLEGFLQPTSSLELSAVKPLLDCLQVPLGLWMEMWPAGHSLEPYGPRPLDPLPGPDDT